MVYLSCIVTVALFFISSVHGDSYYRYSSPYFQYHVANPRPAYYTSYYGNPHVFRPQAATLPQFNPASYSSITTTQTGPQVNPYQTAQLYQGQNPFFQARTRSVAPSYPSYNRISYPTETRYQPFVPSTTTTTTARPIETTTTFRPLRGENLVQPEAPSQDLDSTKDEVLDFSSGSAQVVENTAEKVEEISEQDTNEGGSKGFSIFRNLFESVDLEKELANIGNITIFAPDNKAFEALSFDVNSLDDKAQRRIILKHFVKGTLKKKEMRSGPLLTLGGEYVTLYKDQKNRVRLYSLNGESKLKVSNVKTKWGLVHVIDAVLT